MTHMRSCRGLPARISVLVLMLLGTQVGVGPASLNAQAAAGQWRVEPIPITRIGGDERGDAYALFRVADARRASDGSVLVANRGTSEIRWFDREGRPLRTIGRQGDGPGEFRQLSQIGFTPGDTLLAYDLGTQRMTLFDQSGKVLREARNLSAQGFVAARVGQLANGTWFAREYDQLVTPPPGGIGRDTVRFVRVSAQLEVLSELAAVPGRQTSGLVAQGNMGARETPFSSRAVHGVLGACLITGSGDTADLRIVDTSGVLVSRMSLSTTPRRVTPRDWEAWLDWATDLVPSEGRELARRLLSQTPHAGVLPTVADLVVDHLGYVWVQQYEPPDGRGRVWHVMHPTGTALGSVTMPQAGTIFEVGPDYVVALWEDDFEREIVGVLRLHRPRAAAARASHPGCEVRSR